MSDARLRDLERRFVETGAAEDEVALLVAWSREDPAVLDRLRFASYLGHEPATQSLTSLAVDPPKARPGGVRGWVHAMPGYHLDDSSYLRELAQRVGAALARFAVDHVSPLHRPAAGSVVEYLERWLVFRQEEDRAEALLCADELEAEATRHQQGVLSRLLRSERSDVTFALIQATWVARWEDLHVNAGPSRAAEWLARASSEAKVRAALRADLVPWALGRGDPVRERCREAESA